MALQGTKLSTPVRLEAKIQTLIASKDQKEVDRMRKAAKEVEDLRKQLAEAEALLKRLQFGGFAG